MANKDFFRHLRPVWFDRRQGVIVPQKHGGISFMFSPTETAEYAFWIIICPASAEFSARAATIKLRDVKARNIVPYGNITLDGSPVVELALRAIVDHQLQGEVCDLAYDIMVSKLDASDALGNHNNSLS